MKAGLFLASDFTEGNGANARIKAYAKGLKEEGADVEILFLHASSFNNTLVNNQKAGFWKGIFFKFLNNKVTRPSSKTGKMVDSLRAFAGSTWYILKHRRAFDLFYIYAPKFHQFFHIFLLAKLLGIPTIVEKTELYSALYRDPPTLKNRMLYHLHRLDETYCHYFCNHLVVISHQLYRYYRQFFREDRITLIPIIVDMNRFTQLNGHPKKPYRVGYLGSFGEKDGVPGIIDAFAKAHEEFPDLQLRLIGFNPQPAVTESHINRKGLNGAVENLGQVRYSDIPKLIYQCDLLVVNRTNSAYAGYGFPTKLGEYLATGRPTVVTNVGDIPAYLKHNRDTIIIEPEDTKTLAETIKDRYKHYEFFNQIGENGKAATRSLFDYHIHVKKLYQIFQTLTSEASNPPASDETNPKEGLDDPTLMEKKPTVTNQNSFASLIKHQKAGPSKHA